MQPGKIHITATAMIGAIALSVAFAKLSAVESPAAADDAGAAKLPRTAVAEIHPPAYIKASEIVRHGDAAHLALRSSAALVMDTREGIALYGRNTDRPRPIASLTKLMTAIVTLDAGLPAAELVTITEADRDRIKGSRSRLRIGSVLTRHDLLYAALAASDNRAAAALARTFPGGKDAMVRAMNDKARALTMLQTRFADSTGLDSGNVSTARDLVKLVAATDDYPLIHALTTSERFSVTDQRFGSEIRFINTNRLVRNDAWEIGLSKTGYTAAAGNCLVMKTRVGDRPLIIVLLNSWGKLSKYGDSARIRDWLLETEHRIQRLEQTVASTQS